MRSFITWLYTWIIIICTGKVSTTHVTTGIESRILTVSVVILIVLFLFLVPRILGTFLTNWASMKLLTLSKHKQSKQILPCLINVVWCSEKFSAMLIKVTKCNKKTNKIYRHRYFVGFSNKVSFISLLFCLYNYDQSSLTFQNNLITGTFTSFFFFFLNLSFYHFI